jgi:hypothetical protein
MRRFFDIALVLLVLLDFHVGATTMTGAPAVKNLPKAHGTYHARRQPRAVYLVPLVSKFIFHARTAKKGEND